MAKKSSLSFQEIIKDIKERNFAPVYLLMGEEDYYIDRITEELEKTVVNEEERDFNATTFYGADTNVRDVISRAQQYPLMADKQLVILKEAQAMENAKNQLENMVPYFNHLNLDTVLVVTYKGGMIPANSGFVKSVGNTGVVMKSEKLRDYQLTGPVADYCKENNLKINDRSIALLCEYIGSPLSKIFSEIDKLKVAAGTSLTITPELIESIIGISKEYNSFELIKALSIKDFVNAMKIVKHFSKNPKSNPGVVITATLFNYFSKLFIASILKDKSDSNLLEELDLKSNYALNDYKNGLRHYKPAAIDAIIHELREHDAKTKGIGSAMDENELLIDLVSTILLIR